MSRVQAIGNSGNRFYKLRPETVESYFYMWRWAD